MVCFFFFSSRRRHTRFDCDWSSDVCSSDLEAAVHALPLEVDGELILAACGLMAAEQLGALLGQEAHGHEPVLTAVREEDVREGRREDRAEAVLAEGPDRVFARRAAAEVLPGEEDARAPGAGVVELEVRVRTTVGPEAPVVEQG